MTSHRCEHLMPSRRSFLRIAGLGGAAGVISLLSDWDVRAAGQADALLLTCMDYRLIDAVGRYMTGRGLKDKYDQVILAGASLGALTEKYPAWTETFRQHLDTAIQLHGIHKVIVIDHRDCGAYKVILGEDLAKDPIKETAVHGSKLKALREQIKAKHGTLEVELLLMSLDGKVEAVKG
jgi:carbonic anhydrase